MRSEWQLHGEAFPLRRASRTYEQVAATIFTDSTLSVGPAPAPPRRPRRLDRAGDFDLLIQVRRNRLLLTIE